MSCYTIIRYWLLINGQDDQMIPILCTPQGHSDPSPTFTSSPSGLQRPDHYLPDYGMVTVTFILILRT